MEQNVFFIALNFLSGLNLFIAFLSAVALTIILAVTFSILAVFNKFLNGKNFTYISACACMLSFLSALALINVQAVYAIEKIFLPLLYVGVAIVTFVPVKLVKGRLRISEEQIDLAKLIGGEYKRNKISNSTDKEQAVTPQQVTAERIEVKPVQKPQIKEEKEIDFSHVKNVIERLNFFSLAPSDKRTVSELAGNVNLAEQGEVTPDLKGKINDGLGALLKMMSKYGV